MINIVNKRSHVMNDHTFYIGRGSPLGNIYYFKESSHAQAKFKVNSVEIAIAKYKEYLNSEIACGNPQICDAINELIIKKLRNEEIDLLCYCFPLPCHGNIIKDKVENSKYCINWFSNMKKMDKPILYQNINYWAVENFYQAMKVDKKNVILRQQIAQMNPFEAKVFSRNVELRKDWDEIKLPAMEYALKNKFNKDTAWGQKLIKYKGKIYEYNNWGDKFWGIDIFTMSGENNLGKILDKIQKTIIIG